MRQEGRIVLGVFAFHLIYGLKGLAVPGGQFITPHLLDDLIVFCLSIYFLIVSKGNGKFILLGSLALNSAMGFIAAPQFLAIFDNFLDLEGFANFLRNNEASISLAQIIILSLFFVVSSIWSVWRLKNAQKPFKWFLWIRLILFSAGYAASLIFKINLIYVLSAIFVVDGLMITNSGIESIQEDTPEGDKTLSTIPEDDYDLNETEYRYVLLIFLSMLLIILEYISTSGLISS